MHWFPSCAIGATSPLLLDRQYTDFDEQAERLAGYDQSYLQLTPGVFAGRFFSGFLGPHVSIHLEYCSQALEQKVGCSTHTITFGVVLSRSSTFRANGRTLTSDDVMVLPPGGQLDMVSPVNGAIMALVIDYKTLLAEPGLAPQVADWMGGLEGDLALIRAPQLAERLREDAIHALESAGSRGASSTVLGPVVGSALVAGIAAKLSLEWAAMLDIRQVAQASNYERFMQCRDEIRAQWQNVDQAKTLAEMAGASKRSIELAFCDNVSIGPLTYLRVLRLHKVRRDLLDPSTAHRSIGDIAALCGFWNWSRFSQTYRTHFGEPPSATRRHTLS